METFGVFDGGEQAATTQRGQFVQTSANRSAVVATQPRGPRPASQNQYRAPNPSTALEVQNDEAKKMAIANIGDRSLLGMFYMYVMLQVYFQDLMHLPISKRIMIQLLQELVSGLVKDLIHFQNLVKKIQIGLLWLLR